jgi:pilus assembly protein CpaE
MNQSKRNNRTLEGTAESEHFFAAPEISVQAFCETVEVAASIQAASEDRRLAKARLDIKMGGIAAAIETYQSSPTPNLIILETSDASDGVFDRLHRLASVCDRDTKIMLIGSSTDTIYYRDLAERGVSDYLVRPTSAVDLVRSICEVFATKGVRPVGQILAVIGAAGGVGASTIAHNLGFMIAKECERAAVIVDLDLAFGTASLNCGIDPPGGIADLIALPDQISASLVDRLQFKINDRLSLLAAPSDLDQVSGPNSDTLDSIYGALRAKTPWIILDIPLEWNAWVRRALLAADKILIVASPNLANLRNIKTLIDCLKRERPNDAPPQYCLNRVGISKVTEIGVQDFARAIEQEPSVVFHFDPLKFDSAANKGQFVAESFSNSDVSVTFAKLARLVTAQSESRLVNSDRSTFLGRLREKIARLIN